MVEKSEVVPLLLTSVIVDYVWGHGKVFVREQLFFERKSVACRTKSESLYQMRSLLYQLQAIQSLSSFDILTCQEIKEKNPTYNKILKKFRKEKYRVYF